MELLSGHTLGEIIKAGGPVPAGKAVRIARQVAAGLGAAHAAGIVHRDMKPDNVFLVGASAVEPSEVGRSNAMLGERVDVRIVDFGAAKVAGSGKVTRAGIVFGTPHYMSPEQASGGLVDHRADVYALGIIMYEMFTGRVPFEADTYMGVLTQHMFVQPIPPSQIIAAGRELGALEEITLRCLEKKPEARYGSMEELSAAIDTAAVLRDDGHVEVAPRGRRSDTTTRPRMLAAMADELEPPTFEEKRAKSHRFDRDLARRAVAAGGAFIVATALAAALVKWIRGGPVDPAGEKMTIGVSASPSAPALPTAPATATATASTAATATAMPTPTPTPAPTPVPTPTLATTGADSRVGQVAGPGNVTHRAPGRRAPPVAPPAIDDVGDPFAPRAPGK
jgi:serine/threonine-protein kinase